ncbi:MAG: hypothetical protein J5I91_02515 [Bacteroidetes bacterium]|nr:hypothetical protein [Bacteroidota bacterium]
MELRPEILQEEILTFEDFKDKLRYALSYFEKLELAKKRLSFYRWKTTEGLEKNILEFENAVKRTGGNILWGNEVEDSINAIKSIVEINPKSAYVPSKIASEIAIDTELNIPALEKYQKNTKGGFPDLIIAQAKFLVSNSGHICYCTNNRNAFDSLINAKTILFVAGIESLVHNGVELELAKNLYSTYELGEFGYPLELTLKPGKPDNRIVQQVYLLLVDHKRSNLLGNKLNRRFLPLLNFDLPREVAQLFWKQKVSNAVEYPFQDFIIDPMRSDSSFNKKFLFSNNGYNRLSEFLPIQLDIHDYFIQSRLAHSGIKKSNLLRKIINKDYVKPFLQPKTKMTTKKFVAFMKDKIMTQSYNPNHVPEISFIEQYCYNKRKI